MALTNSVSYSLGTLDAANEYTKVIFVEDFDTVVVTAIGANSVNATAKFYAGDSDSPFDLSAAASATNIYSPIEVLNADT